MNEEWKYVEGYDKVYQVSNMGRCKIVNYRNTNTERILKPSNDKDGYLQVNLYKHGKAKCFRLNRLILITFEPTTNMELQCNHKDEDRTNNNLSNLNWLTSKDNTRFSQSKAVVGTHVTSGISIRYNAVKDAVRDGFNHVSKCCKDQNKICKGYRWRYENII